MSRGRKPSPKAQRQGTAKSRKKTEIVPVEYSQAFPLKAAANIPAPSSLPEEAHDLWRVICTEVARHELRQGDMPLVEQLCVAAYRHRQAALYINKHGLIVETEFGTARNPMLSVERESANLYLKLANALGLSPEARVRLDLMQIAGQSLLATLKAELDGVVVDG
jgi:P27 family predicted phage terminase small subunit